MSQVYAWTSWRSYLWLRLPVVEVRYGGETAEIDVDALADEHVAGGDNIYEGRGSGVV